MEQLRFAQYNKKYYESCINLIKSTWNLHDQFENIQDLNIVYEHYFKSCMNWNRHLEIIVDDQNAVKGILFGSIEDDSFLFERKCRWYDYHLAKWLKRKIDHGALGNKEKAKSIFKMMALNDERGEKYSHLFDSEINLFIVSPELRGQGLGIKLMDHFIEFCRQNHLKRVFLWTDQGCSYSFYEKYGFSIHSRFTEDNHHEEETGMIYYLDIEKKDQ